MPFAGEAFFLEGRTELIFSSRNTFLSSGGADKRLHEWGGVWSCYVFKLETPSLSPGVPEPKAGGGGKGGKAWSWGSRAQAGSGGADLQAPVPISEIQGLSVCLKSARSLRKTLEPAVPAVTQPLPWMSLLCCVNGAGEHLGAEKPPWKRSL